MRGSWKRGPGAEYWRIGGQGLAKCRRIQSVAEGWGHARGRGQELEDRARALADAQRLLTKRNEQVIEGCPWLNTEAS